MTNDDGPPFSHHLVQRRSSMSDPSLGDLSTTELRVQGTRLLEWIGEYLDHPERHAVVSRVAPGEIRASLPDAPPATAESLERIITDFEQKILPGVTHWNHPGFFAYFSIS